MLMVWGVGVGVVVVQAETIRFSPSQGLKLNIFVL